MDGASCLEVRSFRPCSLWSVPVARRKDDDTLGMEAQQSGNEGAAFEVHQFEADPGCEAAYPYGPTGGHCFFIYAPTAMSLTLGYADIAMWSKHIADQRSARCKVGRRRALSSSDGGAICTM